ncbi:hypothetical protein NIES46_45490 [Arthrospira platensis NIES-46]|uniref:Transposase n=1 Tax=Limnospira platensis NIES-46 TaxID=1236695 RepID=A0A5M3TD31_LIMPL|nr:hypothetical protein [Arthrospira platensis]GCE96477.1 hypothetical protein NIES46_45490 [Arthrospira platensis NIES-46]
MMINSVPGNGKLQPELAFAYPLGSATYRLPQKCDRAACPPEVSPTLSEVRPIAYSLGSAFAQRARQKYRLAFRKCDRILPESDRIVESG